MMMLKPQRENVLVGMGRFCLFSTTQRAMALNISRSQDILDHADRHVSPPESRIELMNGPVGCAQPAAQFTGDRRQKPDGDARRCRGERGKVRLRQRPTCKL